MENSILSIPGNDYFKTVDGILQEASIQSFPMILNTYTVRKPFQ